MANPTHDLSATSSGRLAQQLIRLRWLLLAVAIVLAAVSYYVGSQVRFDHSVESMFAPTHPRLQDYQRLQAIFDGSEIVLVVYDDPELFTPAGLDRLGQRAQTIKAVAGVEEVLSLAEINRALEAVYVVSMFPDQNNTPILNQDDEIVQKFLAAFEGYTHGRDHRTVAMVCLLETTEPLPQPKSETLQALKKIASQWPQGRITGEPVLVEEGFRFLQRDGRHLDQLSMLLMSLVIVVCFRSLRWVVIPIAVMKLALWMTLAAMVMVGWQLTMVSSMLSAIVTVVSVATVIHITVRYRESRFKHEQSRKQSVELALESMLIRIFWTCVTTAAGFAALTIAEVEPVRDFGFMMAVASLNVFVATLLLIPGLALWGNVDADPQPTWGEQWLKSVLKLSGQFVSSHAKQVVAILLLSFLSVGWGFQRMKVETDFTKNFREDSEIVQAYRFVESHLGGAGVLDVVIPAPASIDMEFLETVDGLQDELRQIRLAGSEQPALSHVVSFADADRAIRSNKLLAIANPVVRFEAMKRVMPSFANQMKTAQPDENGQHYFRIMLRTSQQKSADEQTELIASIDQKVEAYFPNRHSPAFTTGFFVLLSDLVNGVLRDQTKTFLVAILFIFLVVLVAFRSMKLAIISLFPNVLPIIGLLGMLGWLGIRVNMGVAMIAAVSMGLSIDGTIHYISAYLRYKSEGVETVSAIQQVQIRIGRPVIYATAALVAGFGSLCTSEFIPTVFFGLLVGLSMLGGLLGNLVLLPVLLTLFDRQTLSPQGDLQERKGFADHD